MTDISPADIAQLDQAHAAGNADLDRILTDQQLKVAAHGPTLAAALLTAELQTSNLDVDYLAGMAALAVTRLAKGTL